MTRVYTAGMWIFGRIVDRYATDGYTPEVPTLELIAKAAEAGIVGLDLNFPFPEPDLGLKEVRAAMEHHRLETVCVTPSIYTRRFARGAFTNPDPAIRSEAVDLALEAVDAAEQLGAGYVKLWPGQDGYDYPFQCNYREYAELAVGGIRSVAERSPAVRFAIEYKLKEPRNRLFWSSAPRTLLALDHLGLDNVGVVIDFGHSLFAKENPAEMLQLVHESGRLVDIELDDNYREWDDDLAPGALHLVETLEFLCGVREIGWQGPLKLDLFPYREDAVETVRESIEALRALEACAERLDGARLRELQAAQDALGVQRLVRAALVG